MDFMHNKQNAVFLIKPSPLKFRMLNQYLLEINAEYLIHGKFESSAIHCLINLFIDTQLGAQRILVLGFLIHGEDQESLPRRFMVHQ